MCNEGELLEKFNIQLSPIPMTALTEAIKAVKEDNDKMAGMLSYFNETILVKDK